MWKRIREIGAVRDGNICCKIAILFHAAPPILCRKLSTTKHYACPKQPQSDPSATVLVIGTRVLAWRSRISRVQFKSLTHRKLACYISPCSPTVMLDVKLEAGKLKEDNLEGMRHDKGGGAPHLAIFVLALHLCKTIQITISTTSRTIIQLSYII